MIPDFIIKIMQYDGVIYHKETLESQYNQLK